MSYGFFEPQAGGNYGKFGLNQNVVLTKFDYNPNGGKNNSAQDCVDIEFQVGDSQIKTRVYEISKAWVEGKEVSKGHKVFSQWEDNLSAYINHIALVYVDKTVLENSLKAVTDFKPFVQTVTSLVKASPKFINKQPVDIFLEWQKKIRGSATQTYLEFPTPEYGRFDISISQVMGDGFKEVVDDKGLQYVKEDGTVHPLKRSSWFVKNSPKYKKQTLSTENTVGDNPFADENVGDEDLPF